MANYHVCVDIRIAHCSSDLSIRVIPPDRWVPCEGGFSVLPTVTHPPRRSNCHSARVRHTSNGLLRADAKKKVVDPTHALMNQVKPASGCYQ